MKTIQELLRHANFIVAMDVYTQGVTDVKRNARSWIVRQIMDVLEVGVSRFGLPSWEVPHGPFHTHVFKTAIVEVVEDIWRPRRDLNPCYRRESLTG